jgi:hypothetical protein
MKRLAWLVVACVMGAASGVAAGAEEGEQLPRRLTATIFGYVVPDQPDFVMVTAPVEIRRLHVEARYNYEAQRSGSAFVGVNAGLGETVKLKVTPMIGAVLGELDGLVPALRLTLTWWKLDLYSESEVVVDFDDAADSFFYAWSELGLSLLGWLRFGAAIQRTRVLQTPLDIQRGAFVGVTIRFVTLTLYEFNAGWTTPTWVGALSVTF